MKTARKALLIVLCAILLVMASVMGTLAYLTSSDEVTNTFTVGNVTITMDETKVDEYGVAVEGAATVKTNDYNLLPGHEYKKDPTIHIGEGSESCWVFIQVQNDIAAIESDEVDTVADQIENNDWTELTAGSGVYYKAWDKGTTDRDLETFATFTIDADLEYDDIAAYATAYGEDDKIAEGAKLIKVTAYAIQMDGFKNDPAGAWEALGN